MRWAHWYKNLPCTTAPFGTCSIPVQPHSPFSPMWPHSNPCGPIQMATSDHRKTSHGSKWSGDELSHMGPRSAPYDCPVKALFDSHSAPFTIQPHVAPIQTHVALFKSQTVVREKQGRYQNDQHDELSHMGPRSAPYDCPIWGPIWPPIQPNSLFSPVQPISKPCTGLFTVQPHVGAPFRGDDFWVQHHKIHQNVQLNQQRKLQQSRLCEHRLTAQPDSDCHSEGTDQSITLWCLWRNWMLPQ